MQQSEMLAQPAATNSVMDSWNQERTLEQLQNFVSSRLDGNNEDLELTF